MYDSKLSLINEKFLIFLRILTMVVALVTLISMTLSIILTIPAIFTGVFYYRYTGFTFDFLLVVGCGIYLVLYDIRQNQYSSK
ncbi:MAG: hypothetical protein ACFFCZ_20745 [Promethearchaeota archaeon]